MKSVMSKVTNVNPNYKDTIDWKTLLTKIVENFILSTRHLMSFNMPQTSAIEGIVEANNEVGGGKYFTYPSSYYPCSATDWNVVQGCKVYDSTSY